MSLLTQDEVLVYPEVLSDDGYGTEIRVPSLSPVKVRGLMQPVSSEEAVALGQSVGTVYRLIARDLPGGAWAKVAWGGRTWDVLGEPQRRRYSAMSAHDSVLLLARTPRGL